MILYTFLINAALAAMASLLVSPIYLAKFSNGETLGPDRLRRGDRRRLQPGARRHRRRPAGRRHRQPRRRLRLDRLPAGHPADPAGAGHPVPPAGPAGPPARSARYEHARPRCCSAWRCWSLLALAPVDLTDLGMPYPGLQALRHYILTLWLVTAIAAMGVNLIVGYAGQETLAQAAFVGIGAYLTAIVDQGRHALRRRFRRVGPAHLHHRHRARLPGAARAEALSRLRDAGLLGPVLAGDPQRGVAHRRRHGHPRHRAAVVPRAEPLRNRHPLLLVRARRSPSS